MIWKEELVVYASCRDYGGLMVTGKMRRNLVKKPLRSSFTDQPVSPSKAMAFSNMSQLNMLCDKPDLCVESVQRPLHWPENWATVKHCPHPEQCGLRQNEFTLVRKRQWPVLRNRVFRSH